MNIVIANNGNMQRSCARGNPPGSAVYVFAGLLADRNREWHLGHASPGGKFTRSPQHAHHPLNPRFFDSNVCSVPMLATYTPHSGHACDVFPVRSYPHDLQGNRSPLPPGDTPRAALTSPHRGHASPSRPASSISHPVHGSRRSALLRLSHEPVYTKSPANAAAPSDALATSIGDHILKKYHTTTPAKGPPTAAAVATNIALVKAGRIITLILSG